MSLFKLNKLKQKEAAAALQKAFKNGNDLEVQQAMEDCLQSIADTIKNDYLEVVQTQDKSILVERGYRQLTNKEEDWYQKFIDASKSRDPKQAFTDLAGQPDGAMPETIIQDVFRELVNERPLLQKINFTYASFSTKWILNDHSIDLAVWGEITEEITKEISSAFKVIDLTLNKLSAFACIALDMLELGPTYLDAYIREVLKDAILGGLEKAIIKGSGKNEPIGLNRDIHKGVSVSDGVYPPKTAIKIKSFMPEEYGPLLANLAVSETGRKRDFESVLLICNLTDYLKKIMPATTILSPTGGFVGNLFPFPTDVVRTTELDEGEAIICLPEEYFMAISGAKEGIITYSDEFKFLEDKRYYKIKTHGNGRAFDNTVAIVIDISELSAAYMTVLNKTQAGA